jgi:RecB family exonuclease
MNLLTNSRMSCARACLRRHQWSYELGVRPIREHDALRMGSVFHLGAELLQPAFGMAATATPDDPQPGSQQAEAEALNAIYQAVSQYERPAPWCQDAEGVYEWQVEGETVKALLLAYFFRYRGERITTLAAELAFDLPLVNPQTGHESRLWRLAGKIDRIVGLPDGRVAVLETKTTGQSLDDASDYWTRLRLDGQLSLYVYAARQLGYPVETVLYDVVRKPEIQPARATPPEKRKYRKDDGKLYAGQREQDETPAEFGVRLNQDILARPEFYFARKEIPRLDADLNEAQAEWWQQARLLRDCQIAGRWFRNPNSCLMPFRCDYWNLCSSGVRPETGNVPAGYQRVANVHPELGEPAHACPAEGQSAATASPADGPDAAAGSDAGHAGAAPEPADAGPAREAAPAPGRCPPCEG